MTYKAYVLTATGAEMVFDYHSECKLGTKKNMDDAKKTVSSIISNREWKIVRLERKEAADPLQGLTAMFDEELTRKSGLIEE